MTFAQIFDMGVACMFAFFAVRGMLRGLTGEIVSLLSLIAAISGAWTLTRPSAEFVLSHYPGLDFTIVKAVCSAAIFMGISLVFAIVGKILRSLVKAAHLSFWDHLAGAVSGAVRALFILLLVYGGISIFLPVSNSAWMKESLVMSNVSIVWPGILKFLTDRGWIDLARLTPDVFGKVQNTLLNRSFVP